VVEGDDHCEAYTAIVWGGLLSRERNSPVEAEAVQEVEGNMSSTAMRGAVAPPWSKTPSRTKGPCRNLGDLTLPAIALAIPGHDRKSRRRSCRGRREESDGCIIPMKPRTRPTTNRWRRVWREGGRSKGRRAATHAPDSVPDSACQTKRRACGLVVSKPTIAFDLRQEPTAGKPHGGIFGGGAG